MLLILQMRKQKTLKVIWVVRSGPGDQGLVRPRGLCPFSHDKLDTHRLVTFQTSCLCFWVANHILSWVTEVMGEVVSGILIEQTSMNTIKAPCEVTLEDSYFDFCLSDLDLPPSRYTNFQLSDKTQRRRRNKTEFVLLPRCPTPHPTPDTEAGLQLPRCPGRHRSVIG